MYQFLDSVQYSFSGWLSYWNQFPSSQRAGVSFVGGIILIYLCIKDRDFEYASIAMGLGALLMFAYALDVTINMY
ncbi:MAG TPA: hypothetical protein VMV15_02360 [Candidatus Binataceae bacterium]|nr:hypothetical protein [Candidatus Binataceae bacterium]